MVIEFCPRCGTRRTGSFRFCRTCGLDYDAFANGLRDEPAAVGLIVSETPTPRYRLRPSFVVTEVLADAVPAQAAIRREIVPPGRWRGLIGAALAVFFIVAVGSAGQPPATIDLAGVFVARRVAVEPGQPTTRPKAAQDAKPTASRNESATRSDARPQPTKTPKRETEREADSARPERTSPPERSRPDEPAPEPGAFGNPWGFDFERGKLIKDPPAGFCDFFACVDRFWSDARGHVVQCHDGSFSQSTGRRACADYEGYWRTLYRH
jgi:hypothetical protein